jgi:hypothetical protein
VANDPHVPGPGFIRPAPKNVATMVAHSGAGDKDGRGVSATPAGGELFVIGISWRRLGLELVFGIANW